MLVVGGFLVRRFLGTTMNPGTETRTFSYDRSYAIPPFDRKIDIYSQRNKYPWSVLRRSLTAITSISLSLLSAMFLASKLPNAFPAMVWSLLTMRSTDFSRDSP